MPETLHVAVGEPVVLAFEAAGGTGYGWVVTSASRDLEVTVGAPRQTRPGLPGAPEVTEVTVVARAAGEHEVLAELRRPWEDAAVDERRITVVAE